MYEEMKERITYLEEGSFLVGIIVYDKPAKMGIRKQARRAQLQELIEEKRKEEEKQRS